MIRDTPTFVKDLFYTCHKQRYSGMSQKSQVIQLYKTLLYLGKDYPLGYDFFRTRLKRAFMKNREETNPEKIKKMMQHGEYVVKELETLYMLKKYRTLKRRYYNETPVSNKLPESESKS